MSRFDKLQSLLENGLSTDSHRVAIRFADQEISFNELDLKMRRLAAGLEDQGVKQGDRVAWFMPNCLEAVFTTLACYRIGAISVPLNYRYLADEACHVMQEMQPSLFVYHTDRTDVVSSLMGMVDLLPVFAVGKGAAADF
ncbi:MAG: long-chain fatty acid--CoA ligase [Desulfobulbaceae bacterium]|nr:long-chain fatty acid--CoA ligase [Desulfobulbaceae bacterium]